MEKLTDQILFDVIKPRPKDSFKGTFGKVTLVGGNKNFGGAIIMASTAAVCSGAVLVTTCTTTFLPIQVRGRTWLLMVLPLP